MKHRPVSLLLDKGISFYVEMYEVYADCCKEPHVHRLHFLENHSIGSTFKPKSFETLNSTTSLTTCNYSTQPLVGASWYLVLLTLSYNTQADL